MKTLTVGIVVALCASAVISLPILFELLHYDGGGVETPPPPAGTSNAQKGKPPPSLGSPNRVIDVPASSSAPKTAPLTKPDVPDVSSLPEIVGDAVLRENLTADQIHEIIDRIAFIDEDYERRVLEMDPLDLVIAQRIKDEQLDLLLTMNIKDWQGIVASRRKLLRSKGVIK